MVKCQPNCFLSYHFFIYTVKTIHFSLFSYTKGGLVLYEALSFSKGDTTTKYSKKCKGDEDFVEMKMPVLLTRECRIKIDSTDAVLHGFSIFAWNGVGEVPSKLDPRVFTKFNTFSERMLRLVFLQENCDGILGAPCEKKCDGQKTSNARLRKSLR